MRTFSRTLERTGVLQVDSVNVLQRAHYMPLFSRMGPYDVELLRRASEHRPRRMVEYWAHVQAFMPVDLWPAMRHRMADYAAQRGKWGSSGVTDELMDSLLAEIADRGASTARELDEGLPRTKDHWGWNWSVTRRALDAMFSAGQVAVASRTSQFEIRYDLPERVLPPHVLAQPTPSRAEASRELVRRAARSHGVATVRDLADYYRMKQADVVPAVRELVEAGEIVPVEVETWRQPAYLHADAAHPRRVPARAVLSPFDPVVWERSRAERLFGFHYRIEIYVPAELREYGYYVLPFLLGEQIVARVDLKADRRAGVLRVPAAYAEPDAPAHAAAELAAELRSLADWLGLADILVEERGDLAPALRGAVAAGR
ncbi:winged helix-turn-helix domain-containing protein [Nocardioides mangrovicus]|uniref:Winged helix-turn-helix domain-containing protein n=2 Tax=Nocardioides mangrovicus TaxID=2478913 RepID=A0A3L8P6X4_9ACTN|nr:winged helix-turn-helix domain-containing protein [Nocardioides mangrovicus]